MKYTDCKKCTKAVVPTLFVGNLILASLKTLIGILGNSSGLIADGAHSATDALSSGVLYFGMKFSQKPADEDHPYGHRNIEFLIAKIVGIFLLLVGVFILFSAVYKTSKGEFVTPDFITLVTAIVAIFASFVMYRFGRCVGTQLNSPAILSVSHEIQADALSSVAIAAGILLTMAGYPALDPIAAGILSLIIIKNSIKIIMDAMNGLVDASVDSKLKRKISNIITRNPDVLSIEFLRTRMMGRDIAVEAGIKVGPSKSVEEVNHIVRELRSDLINLVDHLRDIVISSSSEQPDIFDEPGIDDNLELNLGGA